MQYPENLLYTKDHEWLKLEGDTARMGITAYAQDALGDIVFVELPAVGDTFSAGESCATVESVKAVSDVYAPGSGTVSAVNDALEDAPEAINSAPYEAWIAEFTDFTAEDTMDAAAYAAFVEGL